MKFRHTPSLLFFLLMNFSLIGTGNCFTREIKETAFFFQSDTSKPAADFSPRKATIRSAIIPGWGQVYNKKYWKVPLVWGALGTTAAIYFYNVDTYRSLRDAYRLLMDGNPINDTEIDPRFKNLSPEAIRSYRNSFRQNMDYAVLFFLLFWGLNVVDATVDAHLKSFDVSDKLSIQIGPATTPGVSGIGIRIPLARGRHTAR
jgi:hypothetical protein